MSTEIQIRQALERAEEYIARLATFSDKKLEKHLDIIHKQSVIAEKEKMTSAIQLLEIWRSQVIQARILKAENNIPDVPSDMELAIADMESFEEKVEQRKEILKEASSTIIEGEAEQPQEKEKDSPDTPEQLSLF
jgi:hypothetical protein